MELQYKTTNVILRRALIEVCRAAGNKLDGRHATETMILDVEKNPYILFDNNGIGFSTNGYSSNSGRDTSFDDFFEAISTKPFEPTRFILNRDYTAEVQEDGSVKVGCQTFHANVILQLADVVKKVLNQK